MSRAEEQLARVRVGPAGWSYTDWSGYAYPTPRPKGFHETTYLAQFFDTIEINTSFYNPIRVEHAQGWIERVSSNTNFKFTAKMWQRFTHHPLLGAETGPAAKAATPETTAEDEKLVRAGFDVLHHAGTLGVVLLQFPFAFHRTSANVAYLESVLKRFADYPLAVEVRHGTWNAPEVFAMLRERGVGFCNIDQPVIGKSLQPSAMATAAVGYVRLHGRRYDTWFSEDETVPSFERYNYLYSQEELRPWVERVNKVAAAARDVYVITNNHYQGKGVVNALELISMLTKSKVKVPEPLRIRYPELEKIADEPAQQPRLF